MFDFSYYTPTKIVFGRGAENRVGELTRAFGGRRALVHYGGRSAVASGLLDRVRAALDAAGVARVELGGALPNPRLSKVREGIELGRREGVDFLLAVGGGSVIDSAKAIAYGLAEPDRDVWELFEHTRQAAACLPVGVVLTIAASGSEMSRDAVITKDPEGVKRGYGNDLCRPRFALMNPELTLSLPDWQTQSGCVDILMHTLERYFTQGGNMDLTDALAEGLLRSVMRQAEILHGDPGNYEARAEVMWAGSLSHNGLTGCGCDGGDFACHALEHELGGLFDVTHGAGLAAVWPAWARHVHGHCLPRFARFAVQVMGVEPGADDEATALAGIAAMEDFFRRIGMPTRMSELGVAPTEAEIARMADGALAARGRPFGSAKVLHRNDIVAIYRAAL